MQTINDKTLNKWIASSAGAGGILVALVIGLTITMGNGYQDFESILRYGDIDIYNAQIITAIPVLKLIYPVDTMYVFSYVTMVFALVQAAKDRKAIGILAMTVVTILAALDFIENNHIIALANNAKLGYEASIGQVTFETIITQTKFNFGLLLTLALSFLITIQTKAATITRWLARFIVLCAPVALLTPLTTLIYIAMNIGLAVMISYTYASQINK